MSDAQPITYRPWQPKAGYEREFNSLRMLYGKTVEDWPTHLREACAERGEALPIVLDPECAKNPVYYLAKSHLRIANIITRIS